ncbi:hypothetical protein DDZ18_07075 [Marinicauda salina]|uniref:Lipoprotein n=1 Tax=Marinicauda salina TaxID=2135793 RepID=A0A2U2BTU2_9PROT|nr:hypothetical protein [Marinicauda salina]PWE17435.1 hypothetical protein DDZ18_07075 [Marinicauda salina]
MPRLLEAGFLAVLLAACAATQTVYGPAADTERAIGYSEQRIESDRWRVSFTAGPDASAATAERLALRRAAELTLESGNEWFEIVRRASDREGSGDSPVSVGGAVGGAVGSGGYSSSGVGLGVSFSPGRERRTTITLEIIAGSGEAPARPSVYDAREVLSGFTPG